MNHRSFKRKFISGNQLSPRYSIWPASDPDGSQHCLWGAVFYNSWLQPLRGPKPTNSHHRGADMYSRSMMYPYIKAARGHQRNQLMPNLPISKEVSSVFKTAFAKEVKMICKIWPTVLIQPLNISLNNTWGTQQTVTQTTLLWNFMLLWRERNFLSFVYVKPANITGLAAGVPKGLSPRKLNLK